MASLAWSVTLTGGLLPHVDAESAWAKVGTLLGHDAARLQARLPVTFNPVGQDQARHQCDDLRERGVAVAMQADDGSPRIWLQWEGKAHGPVSQGYARHALESGLWPADMPACAHGRRHWQALHVVLGLPAPAPTVAPRTQTALHVASPTAAPVAAPTAVAPAAEEAVPSATATPDPNALPMAAAQPKLYAGFWLRAAAYVLDYLIIVVCAFVTGLVIMLLDALGNGAGQHSRAFWVGVAIVVMWLYYASFESAPTQATPGKLAVGLRVTDRCGGRIGFGRATGRFFGMAISTVVLCVGYMMAGWTVRRQALHDLLVGCCVVRTDTFEAWRAQRQHPASA
ncbi:MAG TPA: RDD family protein [Rhodanobacteraceae bacterium]